MAASQVLLADPDHYLVSANGRLGNPPQSSIGEVDRILENAMRQSPANGLVIHFHGGLVTRNYALSHIVPPLTQRYAQAGAYPLFFVWESGLAETFWNSKWQFLRDPAFRELVKKVSEWVAKKAIAQGGFFLAGGRRQDIGNALAFRAEFDHWFAGVRDTPPVDDLVEIPEVREARLMFGEDDFNLDDLAAEINTGLNDDPQFRDALEAVFNAAFPGEDALDPVGRVGEVGPAAANFNTEALNAMFPPVQGLVSASVISWLKIAYFVARIVIAVIGRIRNGRDHGAYCTIVEEVLRWAFRADLIGATVWNTMKNSTRHSCQQGSDTCGWLVLQKLKAMENAQRSFAKITLVGHSTGAIYICNFLDAAAAIGLNTQIEVVFLAPAVTCERFATALSAHGATSLKRFRSFAMRDALEINDAMLKPLYTRSLLYFVSGLLEGNEVNNAWVSVVDMPLAGMQRFFTFPAYGNDVDVQDVSAFLGAGHNRTVWSRTTGAGAGLNSEAHRHGDFDDDDATLESLQAIIRGGL